MPTTTTKLKRTKSLNKLHLFLIRAKVWNMLRCFLIPIIIVETYGFLLAYGVRGHISLSFLYQFNGYIMLAVGWKGVYVYCDRFCDLKRKLLHVLQPLFVQHLILRRWLLLLSSLLQLLRLLLLLQVLSSSLTSLLLLCLPVVVLNFFHRFVIKIWANLLHTAHCWQ